MKKKMTKRFDGRMSIYAIAGLLLFIVIAFAAGYIWIARTSVSPPAQSMEQVTIATNTEYVGTCPVIVAREKGYFASEGITALVQPHTSGKSSMAAVLQGKANLGTVADIPIVFAAMDNVPVTIVATIFRTDKDHGILMRRESGIVTPADLKGKRVGVTLGTSGHFVLEAFLNRQRLSANDVTMHNLRPEEFSAALAHGEVDAVATWQPYLDTLLKQLGGNGTIFYGEDIYEIPYNIVGKRDYVISHPEAIKKVLRALIQGAHYCRSAPDASHEIMAAVMKTDTATWRALWPSYQFNVVLDQSLVLALEDEARWAIKNKLTSKTKVPNYLSYIHLDALESVAPSAVTVIH